MTEIIKERKNEEVCRVCVYLCSCNVAEFEH
jgi:NAD-dependent dihydropyrimidine dehydrogenase PreA subunit